jgi:hypothetical protein
MNMHVNETGEPNHARVIRRYLPRKKEPCGSGIKKTPIGADAPGRFVFLPASPNILNGFYRKKERCQDVRPSRPRKYGCAENLEKV